MGFIPIPNTVEVVFVFSSPGAKDQRVVINVTNAVSWTIGAAEQLASDIVDAAVTNTLNWLATTLSLASLHVTDMSSPSGFSFDQVTGSGTNTLPVAGAGTGAVAAGQAALVTTLRTTSRGRSYRGRNYWPGVAYNEIAADGFTVGSARVTDQQTWVASLIAAIHTDPQRTLVVASRHTGGAPRTTGVTTPVSSFDTNNHLDTQRRRIQP